MLIFEHATTKWRLKLLFAELLSFVKPINFPV